MLLPGFFLLQAKAEWPQLKHTLEHADGVMTVVWPDVKV